MELTLPPDHRFRIVRRLGAGGMGVVYEVDDRKLGRRCALKTLRADDGQALYRLKSEFRQLQDIAHPNLVRFEELLKEQGTWLLAMELVEGVTFLEAVRLPHDEEARADEPGAEPSALADAASSEDHTLAVPMAPECTTPSEGSRPELVELAVCPSDPDRLRTLLRQLASAVAGLHAAGKVHCDLKPSNVLVTPEDRLVVLDFGLVLAQETGRTVDGSILGTPLYMSPEQCIGAKLTPASDWYSVGAMLYEALTGRPPHQGKLVQVLASKQHRDPPPPDEVAAFVPADLAALCMALLRRDPSARPTDDEVLAALAGEGTAAIRSFHLEPRRGPFVGRDAELAVLRQAFAQSLRGKPVAVHVRGASGLGKTTLVQHLLTQLDASVLRGRCYERETVPYKAWDALVDDLSRHLRRLPKEEAIAVLPDDVGALARLFPVLNRLEAVRHTKRGSTSDPDPDALRARAVQSLSELLGRMAARRPIVLFIDDLQWGDRDSVRLLLELVGLPEPPPVLLLLCYRSEDVDRSACLRELLDIRHRELRALATVTLDLAPLSEGASLTLARSLLDTGRPDLDAIAAQIARESLGSPLFANELVRALDSLEADSDPNEDLSLDALILRRLHALDAPTRWLLKTIAVAGAPIPQGAVVEAAGLGAEGGASLDRLRRENLVRCTGRSACDVVETFHDRIRETIVTSLAPAARRERHEAIARALLAMEDADPEQVARQWLLAGKPAEATQQLLLAARAAERSLAFDHAADLLGAVLDAAVLEPEQALAVERRHADALAHAGRAAASARAYLACADRTDGTTSLDLRRRAAGQLFRAGLYDEGLETQRKLFAEVGIEVPRSEGAALAAIAWYSTRSLARRFTLARPTEPLDTRLRLQLDVLSTHAPLSSFAPLEWMALCAQWQYLALRFGDVERAALALAAYHGAIYAYPGGAVFGDRAARAVEAMLPAVQNGMVAYHHRFSLGVRELFQQNFDRGVELLEQAVAIAREAGPTARFEATASEATLAWARVAIGRIALGFEDARRTHAAILRRADRNGEMMFASIASFAALAEDDVERARALLEVVAPRNGVREGYHEYDGRLMASRIDRYLRDPAAFARMEAQWKAIESNQVFAVAATASLARYERAQCALTAIDAGVEPEAPRAVAAEQLDRLRSEKGPASRYFASMIAAALAHAKVRPAEALEALVEAEEAAAAGRFVARAHYARHRRGRILGGVAGERLVAAAEAYLAAEGIADPSGWLALNAPGFGA